MNNFNTKCPFCKIGFTLFCSSLTEATHLDIMWTNEAGLHQECKDLDAIRPYIVPNKDHGSGYSLSEEMDKLFEQLNNVFHNDPSSFSKENVSQNEFMVLLGEFIRYADYMNGKKIKEEVSNKMVIALYDEGKNLKEIIDQITEDE